MTESQRDTREHMARVQANIDQAVKNLAERAIVHDVSKLEEPEHWQLGVTDMSLLDLVEMIADWKAAHDRNGGDFGHSIQVSASRFNIGEQLHAILINAAKELGWL